MTTHNQGCLGNQRGMVLVAAMMIMALLAILAAAGISTSALEVKIAAHDRDGKQAFYLCEAGLEMAKYQTIRGWGEGSAAATGNPDEYTFTFTDTPVNDSWWADDKWVGFTLVDDQGTPCTVSANTNTTPYRGTCSTAGSALDDGTARLYLDVTTSRTVAYSGTGTAATNSMTFSDDPWGTAPAGDAVDGLQLRDAGGTYHDITAVSYAAPNTTLTLSGTPDNGAFTIGRVAVDTSASPIELHWYDDPHILTPDSGAPSATWISNNLSFTSNAWFLVDVDGDVFRITATDFPTVVGSAPGYMRFQLEGSASDLSTGTFQVTTNPWLAVVANSSPNTASYSQSSDFEAPSGLDDYGDVTVTVTADSSNLGSFTVSATSSGGAVGNRKTIAVDAEVTTSSSVSVTNWRQTR